MSDIINQVEQEIYGLARPQEGSSLAVQMARAELDQNVVTAKTYPRSFKRAMNNILSLVTLDEVSAAECVYALPRGGKPITGPSVRFAEIVASQWGNCHCGSRVVAVDTVDKVVIAEGVFWDLETGMKRVAQVRRRITDKNGKLFNEDMIVVTGNAACSVAMREAILKGVPKAIWRSAYDAAAHVISGDVKTLKVRRDDAVKAFAAFGVTPDMICAVLEVEGVDDIDLDEITTLIAMFKAIKSGEEQAETYFPELKGKNRTKPPAAKAEIAKAVDVVDAKPAPAATKAAEPDPEQAKAETAKPLDQQSNTAPVEGATSNWQDMQNAYNAVMADAMDVGPGKARIAYAKSMRVMAETQPDLYAKLVDDLAAFGAGEGE